MVIQLTDIVGRLYFTKINFEFLIINFHLLSIWIKNTLDIFFILISTN